MRFVALLASLSVLARPADHSQAGSHGAAPTPLSPRDSALHALNRLAYGPRPGEVDRVAALGVMNWIERQLRPDRIDDPEVARRERDFPLLEQNAAKLAQGMVAERRERIAE